MDPLDVAQMDILKEIASVGAGNASRSLSQVLDRKIEVQVPNLRLSEVEKVADSIGKIDDVMTIVLLKIVGDISGSMLFFFKPDDAKKLANILRKQNNSQQNLTEEDKSALRELGNILSGSLLNAMANFLNITLLQSIPDIETDMLGAAVNTALSQLGESVTKVLVMETSFMVEEHEIRGKLHLLFDPKSTQLILSSVKNKFNL